MARCANNVKDQKKNNQCSNPSKLKIWGSSRSLSNGNGEFVFCSPGCREDFKKYYNLSVFDRKP